MLRSKKKFCVLGDMERTEFSFDLTPVALLYGCVSDAKKSLVIRKPESRKLNADPYL